MTDAQPDRSIRRGQSDWFILLPILGMMLFSIAFVYSASAGFADVRTGSAETFFWSHLLRIGFGLVILLFFTQVDYHWVERWSKPLLFLAIGMLVYVLFEGARIKGATRWIDLGLVSFQPSELAKYALVLHLGVMLFDKREYLDDFKFATLPMLIWMLGVVGLIALQPNMSTALVISAIGFAVLFVGGVRIWHLLAVTVPALVAAGLYAISAPYRTERILNFIGLHSSDGGIMETAGYQLKQGILAFGSGGLFGVGAGQSRQRGFVPEPFGDFIYSIIGEEYGFVGAVLLLLLFGLIVWRGLTVARNAPDSLGRNLAAGVSLTIGVYAIVNAAVTTGLLPTTGLPMPFVSYGGSSVLFSAAAAGVLLNVSRYVHRVDEAGADVRLAGAGT